MTNILDAIHSPQDLKKLNHTKRQELAEEIREFLLESVSKTGGHLSSNLGMIELTIALHTVFDSPKDKIIFDVGHQGYVHKLLTGRKEGFKTLRKLDGMSGFLKRGESEHDIFGAGHASTSLSAALGISIAEKKLGRDGYIVAVIGDGSLTGGMAYEALNMIGDRSENVLIIVNDNEMSIDRNVGALQRKLTDIRTYHTYTGLKKVLRGKFGRGARQTIGSVKKVFRHLFLPSSFFEELGAKYYGPVDGHNTELLIRYLNRVKDIEGPVVLHVLTNKGHGYYEAENDPASYHGVSEFNPKRGLSLKAKSDFSSLFGDTLVNLAKTNENIMAVTAAMPSGTGLVAFRDSFPDQLIDVGIAEENAVTMSAAMALMGLKPYVAIYSTFLQRAYDQIIHDVALQKAPVVLCVDRSGLVGADGETHQGLFDTSYLTSIPNLEVIAPKDGPEFVRMLEAAQHFDKPLAIKYPRESTYTLNDDTSDVFQNELIKNGSDTLLVGYGRMIKRFFEVNEKHPVDILNHRHVFPLDLEALEETFKLYKNVFIYEENVHEGSLAQKLKEHFPNLHTKTFPNAFVEHGSIPELLDRYGFSVEDIVREINES
ncbi:1-deoxy-D-xylulose-5-phosphate synthase [Guggenheimella bovis]